MARSTGVVCRRSHNSPRVARSTRRPPPLARADRRRRRWRARRSPRARPRRCSRLGRKNVHRENVRPGDEGTQGTSPLTAVWAIVQAYAIVALVLTAYNSVFASDAGVPETVQNQHDSFKFAKDALFGDGVLADVYNLDRFLGFSSTSHHLTRLACRKSLDAVAGTGWVAQKAAWYAVDTSAPPGEGFRRRGGDEVAARRRLGQGRGVRRVHLAQHRERRVSVVDHRAAGGGVRAPVLGLRLGRARARLRRRQGRRRGRRRGRLLHARGIRRRGARSRVPFVGANGAPRVHVPRERLQVFRRDGRAPGGVLLHLPRAARRPRGAGGADARAPALGREVPQDAVERPGGVQRAVRVWLPRTRQPLRHARDRAVRRAGRHGLRRGVRLGRREGLRRAPPRRGRRGLSRRVRRLERVWVRRQVPRPARGAGRQGRVLRRAHVRAADHRPVQHHRGPADGDAGGSRAAEAAAGGGQGADGRRRPEEARRDGRRRRSKAEQKQYEALEALAAGRRPGGLERGLDPPGGLPA